MALMNVDFDCSSAHKGTSEERKAVVKWLTKVIESDLKEVSGKEKAKNCSFSYSLERL